MNFICFFCSFSVMHITALLTCFTFPYYLHMYWGKVCSEMPFTGAVCYLQESHATFIQRLRRRTLSLLKQNVNLSSSVTAATALRCICVHSKSSSWVQCCTSDAAENCISMMWQECVVINILKINYKRRAYLFQKRKLMWIFYQHIYLDLTTLTLVSTLFHRKSPERRIFNCV
jgi:hypothetical protein